MLDRLVALGTLAGAALLIAKTVNVALWSTVGPPSHLERSFEPRTKRASKVPLSAFLERNLFGAMRRSISPDPPPPEDCPPLEFSARLVATLVGEESRASFSTPDGLVLVGVGGEIAGARISEIRRMEVWLEKEGRCGTVTAGSERTPRASSPPKKADETSPLEVQRIGPGEIAVSRRSVEAALSNLMKHSRDQRIIPHFVKGRPVGFELLNIRPGSLARPLGLRNGDVLQRVNGYDLTDVEKLLGLHEKLLAGPIVVDYLRRGRRETLTINLE